MSWKKVSVGEICSVVTKGTTPTTLGMSYVERGIPFLRAQNLQDGKVVLGKDTLYIDQKTNQALSRSIIQENDILLSIAGTIGRSAIVPKGTPQLNCNQAVAILRPTSKINPKFLRLCLDSIDSQAQINGSKVTATISNLSLSQIKGLKIPLPPLPDQKRIAAILDKADVIRRKRRQALKLADDFLRATFLDMFGDPVTNPKGWEVKPLSELCDVRDGTHDSPKYVQDGYPLITSKNVKNGKLDFSEVNLISEDDFLQINKRSAVDVGDIIMPMIGTIGNPVLVETSRKFAIKNVALIKFIQTSIKNDYILHLLKSHYFEWIIQRSNRGGTQKFIALKDIRSFPIPVPDIRQQSKFSDLRMKIKAVNASEDELGSASDTLFNSLTQRAFRGEL
ncbi:MAG: restriction endonuclease subunit S [Deltaproteobacteria bacterium]|nr:restriction endonuclease subunit S [Deltaproteobacteria bacterium]